MTQLQELLIGLTTNDVQALVDNLANAGLTLEAVCEDRQSDFLKNLDEATRASLDTDGELDESKLIALLETKQFVAPEPTPSYAPYDSEQDKINAEARAYLASTDWYVIRLQETGVEIPQEILDARAAARLSIIEA